MPTIVNKTFKEITTGDAASVQRTLQAGDVRAWAAAFGEVDMLAGPGASQGAAGIVTAILTALVGSALPGPGTSIRTTSVQMKGALPIGTAMTARLVVREKLSDQGIVVLDGSVTTRRVRSSRPRSWKFWHRRRGSDTKWQSIGSRGLSIAAEVSSRC